MWVIMQFNDGEISTKSVIISAISIYIVEKFQHSLDHPIL